MLPSRAFFTSSSSRWPGEFFQRLTTIPAQFLATVVRHLSRDRKFVCPIGRIRPWNVTIGPSLLFHYGLNIEFLPINHILPSIRSSFNGRLALITRTDNFTLLRLIELIIGVSGNFESD